MNQDLTSVTVTMGHCAPFVRYRNWGTKSLRVWDGSTRRAELESAFFTMPCCPSLFIYQKAPWRRNKLHCLLQSITWWGICILLTCDLISQTDTFDSFLRQFSMRNNAVLTSKLIMQSIYFKIHSIKTNWISLCTHIIT